jgi:hypothetical protein
MSSNPRGKIGIQQRSFNREDFLRGFYIGSTFAVTKVNELDVFKCYVAIKEKVELLIDFAPNVKIGKYTNSEASRVITLEQGQAAIISPKVVLQQRGRGEMAVFYFPSHITKNDHTYTLRPNQQVIPISEGEMQRILTFLRDYSKCGWRGEYSFRIIDQLLEMVDTTESRQELEDFIVRTLNFIRQYVAENIKAPSIKKILANVKPPVAYQRARKFQSLFKDQVGVPIRTFCGEQRLYLTLIEAARHPMSFARKNWRYTCANFNHAFSGSFGVSPSSAYQFNDIILEQM